jgi:transcriptional regulator with XRE-family HTH domain
MLYEQNTSMADKIVSRNIRNRRQQRGLSATDIGARLGESECSFDEIEAGLRRPKAVTLLVLAKLLQCKLSDFFVDMPTQPTYRGSYLHRG